MAIQNDFLRGAIGHLVYYELNGKQVVRQQARKVKVSPVTLAQATNFGHASKLSSVFTSEFKRSLNLPKLPSLQQRLAGSISRWLGAIPLNEIPAASSIPWIENFRLNTKGELNYLFKNKLRIEANPGENLKLSVISFQPLADVVAPPETAAVHCTIAVASCNLLTPDLTQVHQVNFEINYNRNNFPAQQYDLNVQVKPGELTLVVASVLFKGKKYDTAAGVQDLKWRPIEVIGAVYG